LAERYYPAVQTEIGAMLDQPNDGWVQCRFTARDIEPEELVSPEVSHELEQSVTIPERGMSHAVKLIRTVVKE